MLYYEEKGHGDVLVLLHGNGENCEYFVHQIDYFSKKFRVIAIDTRGHGKSPRGETPFTLNQFADDLLEFFNQKNIQKANVLGFSDGANIALLFALSNPQMVNKLILNGGNLNPMGIKRSVQIPIEIGYKFACKAAKKSVKALKNAEMLGLMVNEPDISAEELANLKIPTLVIVGTKDLVLKEHSMLISSSIEGAHFVEIKGDHFIARKNPKEFNAKVEKFLTSNL